MRNFGCHCAKCRAAQAEYQLRKNASRRERLAADPSAAEHGKNSTYTNWGCRCDQCRAAQAAQKRARRSRAKPR